MNRIYIIGPVGSGKTTLSNKLSIKYNIKAYELDKVVWDDENGIKRSENEIIELFNNIIQREKWIIEDVGRMKFINGVKNADVVYYINLNKVTIYYRCISRWIKQKNGKEHYNYKPTLKSLRDMLKWAKKDLNSKKIKIKYIKENAKEYKIISKSDIRNM